MAIAWQKVGRFGIVAAAGLTITGAFFPLDSSRHTVNAVDEIHVYGSTMERGHALQTGQGSNVVNTGSVRVVVFQSDDPTGLTWLSETGAGTNYTVITNTYKTGIVTTQDVVTMNRVGYTYDVDPPLFPGNEENSPTKEGYRFYTETENRYIWGPYEYYDATNFTKPPVDWDVRYFWSERTWELVGFSAGSGGFLDSTKPYTRRCLVDIYTNAGATRWMADLGDLSGLSPLDRYGPILTGVILGTSRLRLFSTTLQKSWTAEPRLAARYARWRPNLSLTNYDHDAIMVPGPLITNLLRDAAVLESETQPNAITWTVNNVIVRVSDTTRDDTSFLQESYGKLTNYVQFYIDDTLTNAPGTFVGDSQAATFLTATGLWDRLDIGEVVGGSVFFTDEKRSTSITNAIITTNSFIEPYKVAEALRWTRVDSDVDNRLNWTAGSTTNEYSWWGGAGRVGGMDTWAKAKGDTVSNPWTNILVDAGPLSGTWGDEVIPNNFRGWAISRMAKLVVTGINTDMAHTVDFYIKTQLYTGKPKDEVPGPESVAPNPKFDDQDTTASNGIHVLFSSIGPTHSGSVTSDWFGTTNFPPVWCDEPQNGTTNDPQSKGYETFDEYCVIKWDVTGGFQFATDPIP